MNAVICRREHLQAAAAVLACAPAGVVWPLVVLDPPPIDESEYRRRFDDYIVARNARDLAPNAASIALVDAAFEQLTAYRWWAKQQLFAGDFLRSGGVERIVMLFEPPHDEFELIETTPLDRIGPERRSVFPATIARIDLSAAVGDLTTLADVAWLALRDATLPGGAPVRATPTDDQTVFIALAQALATGRRLVFDASAPAMTVTLTDGSSANEAVVIEVAPDARRLLGVLYAARRNARVIVYRQPDIALVEAAREAIQASLERRPADADVTAAKGFWSGFAPVKTAPAPASPLATFRAAVTSVVPAAVVAAVGTRDLTAFTGGLPYNAVNAPGADWSHKPIGHIPDDAALLVLAHLLDAQPAFEVSFNLIFDPGYFTTAETQNVLTELQARVSPPLVLEGWSATILALERLSFDLPLDIIFFNTHGADDGIVLAGRTAAEAIVPGYKLVRETLPSRPLVFNNSCQSWTGVGREFVLTGARGYIGSLWSIDANDAATYAKVVLARSIGKGAPFARAMRDTGISASTELAYVFIGTATDALAVQTDADEGTIRARLLTASSLLRDSLVRWLDSEAGLNPTLVQVTSFIETLWLSSMQIYAEYARRATAAEPAAVDARIDQLEVGSRIVRTLGSGPDIATLHARALELAQATPASDAVRAGWAEQLSRWDATFLKSTGRTTAAIAAYRSAIAAARAAGHSAVKLWLDLSDTYFATSGGAADALDAAHAAEREPLDDAQSDPRRQRLAIVGRLGPASLALGNITDAITYAREGAALADALSDRSEQSEFTADEARAYLQSGDRIHAAQQALEAKRLALLAYDPARATSAQSLYARATAKVPVVAEDVPSIQTSDEHAR